MSMAETKKILMNTECLSILNIHKHPADPFKSFTKT